jgi:DNA-binding transcriptional ArsR family regulator
VGQNLLSQKFQALADPTRRAMLARLRQGEATVNALASPFDMSLPAVSKHIKVLEKAGLISRGRKAQQRPCRISPEGLREIDDWMNAYRELWHARLDRLEVYLNNVRDGEHHD